MKKVLNIHNKRKSLTLLDDIIYSKKYKLGMSILFQNGNLERKLIMDGDDEEEVKTEKPVILCIPGGGFTHCERNRILPEMIEFAEKGYAVVSVDYRLSSRAKFPAQIEDIYTAIRFLKAHHEKYHLRTDRITVLGRSAGGCLAVMAAMNTGLWNQGSEWPGYSSEIHSCIDLYGMVDIEGEISFEINNPYFSKVEDPLDTLAGKYLGGARETLAERAKEASPFSYINSKMSPLLILHGDNDPIVDISMSEKLYEKIEQKKLEERVEFYVLHGAGHGSKEFFQKETKKIMFDFLKKYSEE